MGVKIRNSVTTIALVIVAVLGFGLLNTGISGRGDDNYLLSSKWIPSVMPMHSEVVITVTLDGVTLPPWRRRLSPWSLTMTAEPGVIIKMTAISVYQGTELLDGIIMKNGRSVERTGFDQITGPGTITCIA